MKMLIALLAVACSAHPTARDVQPPTPAAPAAAPARGSGPSLYDLPVTVTSEAGVREALDVDRGHPTLISMFYGSCAAACPLLIDTLDRTLQQLPPASRAGARVLLVSFDPKRDTPERLRELVRVHHLDPRWTLAAASDLDARTLARSWVSSTARRPTVSSSTPPRSSLSIAMVAAWLAWMASAIPARSSRR